MPNFYTTLTWIFSNIILALIVPLLSAWFATRIMGQRFDLSRVIKDGDLFLFTTTLSASSIVSGLGLIAKLLSEKPSTISILLPATFSKSTCYLLQKLIKSSVLSIPGISDLTCGIQQSIKVETIVAMLILFLILLLTAVVYGALSAFKATSPQPPKSIVNTKLFLIGAVGWAALSVIFSYYIFTQGGA